MILADTSVWIHYLRSGDTRFDLLLKQESVVMHPLVVGELACGNLADRIKTLIDLNEMHGVQQARHDEVLDIIEVYRLYGRGLSFIDLHLLASARLSQIPLLTRDKRLAKAAETLGVGG